MNSEIDAEQWIILIGEPLRKDVDGLKQALWITTGGGFVAGAIITALLPIILSHIHFG